MLQEVIGSVLAYEQQRVSHLVQAHLSPTDQEALQILLAHPQGFHEITRLKREPKDFSPCEVTQEIQRGEQLGSLYQVTQRLLPHLEISNESIKYYAWLVSFYSIFRLRQLDCALVLVYLLCFVYHRYQKLHDNLIQCFIHHVRRHLPKAGRVLKLFTDDRIAPATPFEEVQTQAF